MSASKRLRFRSGKYAALSLMAARWVKLILSDEVPFNYVTLGGTELRDVLIWHWIDNRMLSRVFSFERRRDRYSLAEKTAERLRERGIDVVVSQEDIFNYQRDEELPHVFFIDLPGVCKPTPFIDRFRKWLESGTVGPGDLLLITSHLGVRSGWERSLASYDSEFRWLGVTTSGDKQRVYGIAHPLFVLHRALLEAGLVGEIRLDCLGHVKYFDTSTMGLYGIVLSEGQTQLETLIANLPVFFMLRTHWGPQP
jgi:hypothetical protein